MVSARRLLGTWRTPEEKPMRTSRSRRERADSITEDILSERAAWLERIHAAEPLDPATAARDYAALEAIAEAGLGVRRAGGKGVFKGRVGGRDGQRGARLAAKWRGSASFPSLKHAMPEFALIGHSNVGKSTLLNALAQLEPKDSIVGVSDRAGWTDSLAWYSLGRKPPLLYLVDLPGYGHAVAADKEKKVWTFAAKKYLTERTTLAASLVLIDATRGVCGDDKVWLALAARRRREEYPSRLEIVLTKGDLLQPLELARASRLVADDAAALGLECAAPPAMVCGTTGAGIDALWHRVLRIADEASVRPHGPTGVPIHAAAFKATRGLY